MRKLLFFFLSSVLLPSALAYAQTSLVRFGPYELPSVSSQYPPLLQANIPPNSPVLSVCHSPANNGAGIACTNYATTYTGSGSACPNGAQDTPDPGAGTSACQVTGDAQGNLGWWAPPGIYDFTVTVGTTVFGPYTVMQGVTTAGVLPHPIVFDIACAGGLVTTATNVCATSGYITVPFACNIQAYNLTVDNGTITVKFIKIATGTAIPTIGSNSISTSGVGISTGTAIHSTTLTDFTTTAIAQNDIIAMVVTAVTGANQVTGVLQCQ